MGQYNGEADTVSVIGQKSRHDVPYSLPLELIVTDRDVVRALYEHAEGDDRNHFALEALKIGIIALRHVGGYVSADLIHRESTRLVDGVRQTLEDHARLAQERVASSLKEYFDPDSGRFNERVSKLVGKDGELIQLLRGQLDGEHSQLARTLLAHVGRDSPLMKLLDPQQSEGLLTELRDTVQAQLTQQRDHVLKEFSLDNESGALARLLRELHAKHGDLNKELQSKIDDVIKEFSLDEENSALSRLVRNVDRAQRTISSEFSLDNDASAFSRLKSMLEATQGAIRDSLTLDDDQSPLARLKRELMTIQQAQVRSNAEFQEEVKVSLAKLIGAREEARRSTRHGIDFEDAVCELLICEAQRVGDIATPSGDVVGMIKNCKVGDCVIELGPDSPAEGAKIVVEAKEQGGYTLSKAREEIETARKNRGADWGVFVFSKSYAPAGLEPLRRYAQDVVVIWDPEDANTDVYLKSAIVIARALSFRKTQQSNAQEADFAAIDEAINDIEKRSANFDDIRKSAETIDRSAKRILDRVRIDHEALEIQITILREKIGDLQHVL